MNTKLRDTLLLISLALFVILNITCGVKATQIGPGFNRMTSSGGILDATKSTTVKLIAGKNMKIVVNPSTHAVTFSGTTTAGGGGGTTSFSAITGFPDDNSRLHTRLGNLSSAINTKSPKFSNSTTLKKIGTGSGNLPKWNNGDWPSTATTFTQDGKKMYLAAGVLRPTFDHHSTATWSWLDNSTHTQANMITSPEGITVAGNGIMTIRYNPAYKVISFAVTVDETLAAGGLTVGASVDPWGADGGDPSSPGFAQITAFYHYKGGGILYETTSGSGTTFATTHSSGFTTPTYTSSSGLLSIPISGDRQSGGSRDYDSWVITPNRTALSQGYSFGLDPFTSGDTALKGYFYNTATGEVITGAINQYTGLNLSGPMIHQQVSLSDMRGSNGFLYNIFKPFNGALSNFWVIVVLQEQ